MQLELIFSLSGSQELDLVLHNTGRIRDLLDVNDLALPGSKYDPPGLSLGEGEVRSVDQSGLFALLQILARHLHLNRAQVSLIDLVVLIIVHVHLGFHGEAGHDAAAFQDVLLLFFGEVGHSLLVLIIQFQVFGQVLGLLGGLALGAVGRLLLREVGKLQQGGIPDPDGLADVLAELDAVEGRLEGILMLADRDHGIDEAVGVAEHVIEVVLHLLSQLIGLSEKVGVEEHVARDADGMVVLGLLHLRLDLLHRGADLLLFGITPGQIPLAELGASRDDLGEGLDEGVLVEVVMEPGIGVVHDVLLSELGGIGVITPDAEGDDADHDDKVGDQDHVAVVSVEEPGGQADGNLEGLLAVRVAVLLVVLLGLRVREGLVGLGDHHELGLSGGVVGIFVGVVHETHLLVRLLDRLEVGAAVHLEDAEGVEGVQLPIPLADVVEQVHEQGREHHRERQVDEERLVLDGVHPPGGFLDLRHLLLLSRGAGYRADVLVLESKEGLVDAGYYVPP
mmetsp:Transcript_26594/g.54410  ORF Transcript_26594/g.54410 Transcript_26594/m.54410 type:complete len:507 (+) Transcript_26594:535-2055(+)